MSGWNYVVTAHKPTNVTHSCVGYFTNPQELNLIVAYPFPIPSYRNFHFIS
jgi:DNA damage-binding protein 1